MIAFVLLALSQWTPSVHASGLPECHFERHRRVYPVGKRELKVEVGLEGDVRRFTETGELVEFLKSAQEKFCTFSWRAARKEMEEWLSNEETVRDTLGPELDAQIAAQEGGKLQVPLANLASPVPQKSAQPKNLVETWKQGLEELRGYDYDSTQKRRSKIDSLLKLLYDESTHAQ